MFWIAIIERIPLIQGYRNGYNLIDKPNGKWNEWIGQDKWQLARNGLREKSGIIIFEFKII